MTMKRMRTRTLYEVFREEEQDEAFLLDRKEEEEEEEALALNNFPKIRRRRRRRLPILANAFVQADVTAVSGSPEVITVDHVNNWFIDNAAANRTANVAEEEPHQATC